MTYRNTLIGWIRLVTNPDISLNHWGLHPPDPSPVERQTRVTNEQRYQVPKRGLEKLPMKRSQQILRGTYEKVASQHGASANYRRSNLNYCFPSEPCFKPRSINRFCGSQPTLKNGIQVPGSTVTVVVVRSESGIHRPNEDKPCVRGPRCLQVSARHDRGEMLRSSGVYRNLISDPTIQRSISHRNRHRQGSSSICTVWAERAHSGGRLMRDTLIAFIAYVS